MYAYEFEEYTEFVYRTFEFETELYLYVWAILVLMTLIFNSIVVIVLLKSSLRKRPMTLEDRRKSRPSDLWIAIAIFDTLTGLVTLPSYIMVYGDLEPHEDYDYYSGNFTDYDYMYYYYGYGGPNGSLVTLLDNSTTETYSANSNVIHAFILSKSLCHAFMISKFYLSKVFHTVSIWLTLYLGIQRCIVVVFPLETMRMNLFTRQRDLVVGIVIVITAPILHFYHLIDDKTVHGKCTWEFDESCTEGCAHLWATLLLRHLIPCTTLMFAVVWMVVNLQRKKCDAWNNVRAKQNRQVSKIVIFILVVFLITEVPYGIFLLFTTIIYHNNRADLNVQERNRAIHAGYEVVMVLSFNVNFFIYTLWNKEFRTTLKALFTCQDSRLETLSVTSSTCKTRFSRTYAQTANDVEMKPLNGQFGKESRESDNQPNTIKV